jgi:hypothetical protein
MSCGCANDGEMHIKGLKLLLLNERPNMRGKQFIYFWFFFLCFRLGDCE